MPKKLFFLHIPKTAGTTFNAFLEQQYSYDEIIPRRFFGKNVLYVTAEDIKEHQKDLAGISLFRGHYGYEICRQFVDTFTTVTVLRDPLRRVVSLYNDWRTKSEENLETAPDLEKSLAFLAKEKSFEDFIRTDHPLIPRLFYDAQAKMLASTFRCELDRAELHHAALENLNTFDYVGITEAFEVFLSSLCVHMGWHYPRVIEPLNTARHHLKAQDLDADTIAFVKDKNAVDYALYEHAKTLSLKTANLALRQPAPAEEFLDLRSQGTPEITMAMPTPGIGWHVREGEPDALWRWTGPGKQSSIFVAIAPRPYTVQIYVVSIVKREILDDCTILFNGIPLPKTIQRLSIRKRFLITVELPKAYINPDQASEFMIQVPFTASHADLDPQNRDRRQKGIAIRNIIFVPQEDDTTPVSSSSRAGWQFWRRSSPAIRP